MSSPKYSRGITLMELMITVAIVGILGSIAYPSYRDQVLRSGRTEGKMELNEQSQALERCFTQYMSYTSTSCAAYNSLSSTAGVASENAKYVVKFTGTPTATTFSLRATPQGGQTGDTRCGYLDLSSTGARAAQVTANALECWR